MTRPCNPNLRIDTQLKQGAAGKSRIANHYSSWRWERLLGKTAVNAL